MMVTQFPPFLVLFFYLIDINIKYLLYKKIFVIIKIILRIFHNYLYSVIYIICTYTFLCNYLIYFSLFVEKISVLESHFFATELNFHKLNNHLQLVFSQWFYQQCCKVPENRNQSRWHPPQMNHWKSTHREKTMRCYGPLLSDPWILPLWTLKTWTWTTKPMSTNVLRG